MSKNEYISWIPSWVTNKILNEFSVEKNGITDWKCQRPQIDTWKEIAHGLKTTRHKLLKMQIKDIVSVIDKVAKLWCDRKWPERMIVRDKIVDVTGFSPQAVDRSFDVELKNYQADSLWRVLQSELGKPEVLDTFQNNDELPGKTFAIGPDIILAILTGNVPGLPALSIVRALLVKSPIIIKVASGEPCFASHFVKSIYDSVD